MPRTSELQDLLFPVEERPVFVDCAGGPRRVSARKALVNVRTQEVLSIVGSDYRVVTNEQALAFGFECCTRVFAETRAAEWRVSTVDAPATRAHCFIDLVHNSGALDFLAVPGTSRPEAYGPFVRITNSYHGLRALAFDIGYYRKVCDNGLIVRDAIIHFRFSHNRREIPAQLSFAVSHERLVAARATLGARIAQLRAQPIPPQQMTTLVLVALNVAPPSFEGMDARSRVAWKELVAHIGRLSNAYSGELGANAYALMNVITDVASRPPADKFVRRDRQGLQRLAGTWFAEFVSALGPARETTRSELLAA